MLKASHAYLASVLLLMVLHACSCAGRNNDQARLTGDMIGAEVDSVRANNGPIVAESESVLQFAPSGISGKTPIFSWINSTESGIAKVLPDDRWSLPYQWIDGEEPATVWELGSRHSRPLRDNPVGLRAIRPYNSYWLRDGGRPGESKWGYRDELILDRGTSSERSLGFVAPWFDEWRTVGHAKQRALAARMFEAGGQVDYLIMDWEDYNTLYNINRDLAELGVTLEEYRRAVIQDPRWPSLRESLNEAGIAAGYDPEIVNFNDDLADIESGWRGGTSPKGWIWGRYMNSQILAGLEYVLFDSWKTYYPALKASDYQKYISGPWPDYAHATWSVDGPTVPLSEGPATQWIVGTHQAPEGYGTRGLPYPTPIQIHVAASYDPPRLPTTKWNPPAVMDEKFAVLVKVLRKVRGAVLNQDAAGNPQLMMWVSGDQYVSSIWVPAGGAADYQWYAEAIFHYALHDVKAWLAWNTFRKTDGSSERRLTDIVNEVDSFIGGIPDRKVLTKESINWDTARFIVSGMEAGEWRIYRFTPGEAGQVISDSPFVFRFESDSETVAPIEGGRLFPVEGTESQLGYWLVAPVL